MAEEKKVETLSLLNRGQRSFALPPIAGKPQFHLSGQFYAYPLEEAKKLLAMYPKDLVDATKLPGAVDTKPLKDENAALKAENLALKEQLAALEPKKDEPKDEEKGSKKKDRVAA